MLSDTLPCDCRLLSGDCVPSECLCELCLADLKEAEKELAWLKAHKVKVGYRTMQKEIEEEANELTA